MPTLLPLLALAALAPSQMTMPGEEADPITAQGPPNAQMQKVLDQLADYKNPPYPSLSPLQARQLPDASDAAGEVLARMGKPATDPTVAVSHMTMNGPGTGLDRKLVLRVYRPQGTENQKLPIAVFLRGGGWTIASLDSYDASARAMAKMANAVVVSVSFRTSPEAKFPAAHEDSYAAFQYVAKNAAMLGGDANRIAIIGESAGGNMANAVSMMALDRGGVVPKGQVLVYPVTQLGVMTRSYGQNQTTIPLNTPTLLWMGKNYTKPADARNEYLSPLTRASDAELKRLPPTTIILAEIDPLRTEGAMYGARLKALGVETSAQLYRGVTHEFFGMGALVDEAMQAEMVAADALKAAFAR